MRPTRHFFDRKSDFLAWIIGPLLALFMGLAASPALPEPNEAADLSQLALRFEEPLVSEGPTAADEDHDLTLAITAYRAQAAADDLRPLQEFLSGHPQSGWRLALLTNIGLLDYHYGYFARALDAFEQAWAEGRSVTEPHAKALADRAAGELVRMHARLGHVERLAALLDDDRLQTLTGAATELRDGAREGLWLMRNQPAVAFLCGPKALENLLLASRAPKAAINLVDRYQTEGRGATLAEVGRLAERAGVSYRLIHRDADSAVPVPSVVHWKVNFAAIVAERGGRFQIDDPTFGRTLWVTRSALDAEASGYFLVLGPAAADPGWRAVGSEEAEQIRGMGTTSTNDPSQTMPADPDACGSCSSSQGMAQYNFKEMLVSLNITDMPVGYAPPKGPAVFAKLVYNQREASQPATFSFFNVSPKWTLNWLSYIEDDPTNPGGNVTRVVAGGGYVNYTGYSSTTGTFTPEVQDASVLTLASNQASYTRSLKDGSIEVYSLSNGATSFPRLIFLTAIIDPAGNALTFHYDSQLRLTSVVDATGRATSLSYGLSSNPLLVTAITDPFGRSAQLTYDGSGRLSQITDVLGLTSTFTYDSSSLVNSLTTPYGKTSFAYGMGSDGNSRFARATDPLGHTERLEFVQGAPDVASSDSATPQGMPVPLFNEYLSSRDTFYWDKHAYAVAYGDYTKPRQRHWAHLNTDTSVTSGTLESVKYPLENRIWYTYPGQQNNSLGAGESGSLNEPTGVGRVLDNGATQLTLYQYNGFGNVTNRVDPVGRQTALTYAANQIDVLSVKQQTASGFVTIASYSYNAQHRPLTYTDAAGETTQYRYNAAGQLTQMIDALGRVTAYYYDSFGYLTAIVNANGKLALTLTYDAYGRVATSTDSEGWTVAFDYDALDRVTKKTFPDGTSRTFAYNKLDLASVTDRQGRTTVYTHDAVRQLVAITDPLGNITRFVRYENGVLKALVDPLGHVMTWTIDVENRLLSKQYPDGRLTGYGYEAATGRLLFVADQLNQIKQFAYTPDDRLAGITYLNAVHATPNIAFAYDPYFPLRTAMTDGTGTTSYLYHTVGTPGALKLALESPPFANTATTYTYDALGRVSKMSVGGNVETFAYDALGRLVTHADDLGTFNRTYLGETGQLVSQGNGVVGTAWSYANNQNDRRLVGVANGGGTTYGFTTTPEDDITGMTDSYNSLSWTYGYDNDDRLKSAASSASSYSYGYDRADNLALIHRPSGTTTVASTVANEIASAGGVTFSYDVNGNLLRDYARTYVWDADNRLITIGYLARPGVYTTFRYDGLGRRVAVDLTSSSTKTETRYLWCGQRMCQARTSSNTVIKRYFREGEETTAAKLYYGVDQLGSVHDVLVAGTGALATHFDYEPYGAPTATGQAVTTDFRYAGLFYEPTSGLYLSNYRAYDPQVGRWVTRDPIGGRGGVNLYRYGRGNPTGFIDPFGLSCDLTDEILAAIEENPWLIPIILATEIAGGGPENPLADAAVIAEIEAVEAGAVAVESVEAAEAGSAAAESVEAAEATSTVELDTAESWGNPETLEDHFGRHGADFEATSQADYAEQASEFLQRSQAEGLPTKIDASGTIRTYDSASNTFGSYNPDGTTKTFFKPGNPNYWGRQPGVSPTYLGGN